MIGKKVSLLNIYVWNVLAIVFFCIKILPQFYDIELNNRILIALGLVVFYAVLTQIKIVRQLICAALSFMWGILISQTLVYYFGISDTLKWTVTAVITVVFYLWHLIYMENPFNIISAVSIELPKHFSPDVNYVPQYNPLTESEKSGNYATQYLNEKKKLISAKEKSLAEKIEAAKRTDVDRSIIENIVREHNFNMKKFYEDAEKILKDCFEKNPGDKTAAAGIDLIYNDIIEKTGVLESKIGECLKKADGE